MVKKTWKVVNFNEKDILFSRPSSCSEWTKISSIFSDFNTDEKGTVFHGTFLTEQERAYRTSKCFDYWIIRYCAASKLNFYSYPAWKFEIITITLCKHCMVLSEKPWNRHRHGVLPGLLNRGRTTEGMMVVFVRGSVLYPYWSQYGSGSSILGQYGSGFGSRYFHDHNERKHVLPRLLLFQSLIALYIYVHWLRTSKLKPSAKWSMLFLTWKLKSQIFSPFGHHFDCPGSGSVFTIRIQGSHFNTDPRESVSRSETLVRGLV